MKLVNDIVKMKAVDELTIEPKSELFLQQEGLTLCYLILRNP